MFSLSRHKVHKLLVFFSSVFTSVFLVCALFSCSPHAEQRSFTSDYVDDSNTLKKETELRKQTLVWTEPLRQTDESEENAKNTVPGMFFSDKIRMATGSQDENVYPSYPNLGSMDVSKMSSALYTKLTEFLTGVKNKSIKSDNQIFAQKYIGVVFLYELSFYPEISNWYVGSPFISMNNGSNMEDIYEIPVLFMGKNGKFNCWISIDATKAIQNEFIIKQIVLGDLS